MGRQITLELAAAIANGLDQRVAQGLAASEAFAALLTKIGIRPSDKLIAGEIQKILLSISVSGRFDRPHSKRPADNNLTATTLRRRCAISWPSSRPPPA